MGYGPASTDYEAAGKLYGGSRLVHERLSCIHVKHL